MSTEQAHELLSQLRTYENAVAADMEREWQEAWDITSMADYDERAGL